MDVRIIETVNNIKILVEAVTMSDLDRKEATLIQSALVDHIITMTTVQKLELVSSCKFPEIIEKLQKVTLEDELQKKNFNNSLGFFIGYIKDCNEAMKELYGQIVKERNHQNK
ncbi:hypothetical protein [Flammeovirga sp. OC4]|uniref:hypothetical protein n=1 Tax=Flammeovirga sp. OC4 TaxID=1382345 RepID=UPI0005C76B45|nr:hypothetical protein [Flammeovirga sp. OC4]